MGLCFKEEGCGLQTTASYHMESSNCCSTRVTVVTAANETVGGFTWAVNPHQWGCSCMMLQTQEHMINNWPLTDFILFVPCETQGASSIGHRPLQHVDIHHKYTLKHENNISFYMFRNKVNVHQLGNRKHVTWHLQWRLQSRQAVVGGGGGHVLSVNLSVGGTTHGCEWALSLWSGSSFKSNILLLIKKQRSDSSSFSL